MPIQAAVLLRVGSLILHAGFGGLAVFSLVEMAVLPYHPHLFRLLILTALKSGGLAAAILYCRAKYLDWV